MLQNDNNLAKLRTPTYVQHVQIVTKPMVQLFKKASHIVICSDASIHTLNITVVTKLFTNDWLRLLPGTILIITSPGKFA